jgi:hypothetical protein
LKSFCNVDAEEFLLIPWTGGRRGAPSVERQWKQLLKITTDITETTMEMPDLPPAEKAAEQRRAMKWWIQHSHTQEDKIEAMRQSMREMLPIVMKYYSQELWAAGWLDKLEEVLPPQDELVVGRAAGLLGEIPYWDVDAPEDEEGFNIGWKKFPF